MTPRGPDRYEAKAKELCLTEWRSIAAALRAEHDDALERAAHDYERAHAYHRGLHGSLAVAAQLREMKSPAAAPEKAQSLTKEESHGEQADRGGVREGSRAVDGDQAREGSDLAQVGDRRGVDGALLGPERGSEGPRSGQRQGDVGGSGGGRFSAYGVAPPSEPAPLLPRVLAALETEANAYRHRSFPTLANQLHALAAELRAYIAEQAAVQKKQGDVPGE